MKFKHIPVPDHEPPTSNFSILWFHYVAMWKRKLTKKIMIHLYKIDGH